MRSTWEALPGSPLPRFQRLPSNQRRIRSPPSICGAHCELDRWPDPRTRSFSMRGANESLRDVRGTLPSCSWSIRAILSGLARCSPEKITGDSLTRCGSHMPRLSSRTRCASDKRYRCWQISCGPSSRSKQRCETAWPPSWQI